MGHAGGLQTFRQWYAEWGVWVILIKGATPIPYKLVTIASGLAAFNFPVFVVASIATRGVRFFLVAMVLKRYGPAILSVVERRLTLTATIVVAIVVAGFLVLRYWDEQAALHVLAVAQRGAPGRVEAVGRGRRAASVRGWRARRSNR